jgi:hypothetical protein
MVREAGLTSPVYLNSEHTLHRIKWRECQHQTCALQQLYPWRIQAAAQSLIGIFGYEKARKRQVRIEHFIAL